jgi:hypothetical protein
LIVFFFEIKNIGYSTIYIYIWGHAGRMLSDHWSPRGLGIGAASSICQRCRQRWIGRPLLLVGNGSRGCYRRNHLAKPDLPGGINRKAGLCALRLLPPVTACARSWLLPCGAGCQRRAPDAGSGCPGQLTARWSRRAAGPTDRPTDGLAGPVTGDGDWTGLAGFVATQRDRSTNRRS